MSDADGHTILLIITQFSILNLLLLSPESYICAGSIHVSDFLSSSTASLRSSSRAQNILRDTKRATAAMFVFSPRPTKIMT